MSLRTSPPPWALVVGGGLCGSELAWGLASADVPTLLVTTSLDTIANLPSEAWRFDPPPGGVLDRVADEARAADGAWRSWPLHRAVKRELERLPHLHVLQSNVTALVRGTGDSGRVEGVRTWEGVDRHAQRVALCTGTFLRSRLEMGTLVERAGRLSEMTYDDLHDDLLAHGVPFEEAVARLDGDALTPGYVVRHQVVAPSGVAEDGALAGLPGAWAFGACARAGID
ncbi:MAG: FAD-dependent oxidoreductase, partial [Trueperaceae bacterium]|nr:FAD-dependent oxidoreductase [Trueperaceae bacterium]